VQSLANYANQLHKSPTAEEATMIYYPMDIITMAWLMKYCLNHINNKGE